MLTLNIGEKELRIKFSYEATLKTRVLSKLVTFEQTKDDDIEQVENMLLFLPELLLVGLQKFHRDEYGFNYDNGFGRDEALAKTFELVEEYCDEEDNDAIKLFQELEDEMLTDGFLAGMFRKEQEKTKPRKNAN